MKAAVLNDMKGSFDIEEVQIDAPKGREVLVQVKASGLCHTDHYMAVNPFGFPLPALLGHELAGVVSEIGPEVREFAVGDHVVGSNLGFCGHCDACLKGRTYLCEHTEETKRNDSQSQRVTRNGQPVTDVFGTSAFAEYSLVHESSLVKVPKELPFPQAAVLGCGCVTGAGAVLNSANVKPGETIAVIGIGGVGLNVISGARLTGALRIIALDVQSKKEVLARKFGATDFINASACDPIKAVKHLTGSGVDHAFEAAGLKLTSEQAINMVKPGGSVYFLGMHTPGSSMEIDPVDLILRQVALKGVLMGSTNAKIDILMYANLYLQGRFNLDDLVSKEINISEINDAYKAMKNGDIVRCVITSF
jgi:S-(hydroxymethyl)glutathione dehydrogenase / alcohol dehydrogenase